MWTDLSMKDKSDLMSLFLKYGISSLSDMRRIYDGTQDTEQIYSGGDIKESKITATLSRDKWNNLYKQGRVSLSQIPRKYQSWIEGENSQFKQQITDTVSETGTRLMPIVLGAASGGAGGAVAGLFNTAFDIGINALSKGRNNSWGEFVVNDVFNSNAEEHPYWTMAAEFTNPLNFLDSTSKVANKVPNLLQRGNKNSLYPLLQQNAYRIINEEGLQDVIDSGVIRPKQSGPFSHTGIQGGTWFSKGKIASQKHPDILPNGNKIFYRGDYVIEINPTSTQFPKGTTEGTKDLNYLLGEMEINPLDPNIKIFSRKTGKEISKFDYIQNSNSFVPKLDDTYNLSLTPNKDIQHLILDSNGNLKTSQLEGVENTVFMDKVNGRVIKVSEPTKNTETLQKIINYNLDKGNIGEAGLNSIYEGIITTPEGLRVVTSQPKINTFASFGDFSTPYINYKLKKLGYQRHRGLFLTPNGRIIRDVKPANVGYNNGNIFIFDPEIIRAFGGRIYDGEQDINDYQVSLDNYSKYKDSSAFTTEDLNVRPAPINYDELALRQRYAESTFNNEAVSPKGAKGAYGIMPHIHKWYVEETGDTGDLTDLAYNTRIRDWLMERNLRSDIHSSADTDSVRVGKLLVQHNYGSGNTRRKLKELEAKGIDTHNSFEWLDAFPKEPREYTNFVLRNKDINQHKNTEAFNKELKILKK